MNQQQTQQVRKLDPISALLTASAFVIAGLFIVTMGKVAEQPAYAQAAVSSNGTTMLSMRANVNNDIVVTLDEAAGHLRVFAIGLRGGQKLEQHDKYDLAELFAQAQRASRGR